MAEKKRTLDALTIVSIAAQKEGLSYGKYMVKHGYNPPCLRNPAEMGKLIGSAMESGQAAENLCPAGEVKWQKQCPVCGRYFQPGTRRVYCSDQCQAVNTSRREKARRLEGKQPRYCEVCGKPIPLNQSVRVVTCSKACSAARGKAEKRKRDAKYRDVNKSRKGE